MKQKLLIVLLFILIGVLLVGLNAASYTQKQKEPDTEAAPNRSSFNAGSTGTQAFYTLLAETGRRVTRWQEPPAALLTRQSDAPSVFVVVGAVRRNFTDADNETLLKWVSNGGRLVMIDREPPEALLVTTANWRVSVSAENYTEIYSIDPADATRMTSGIPAVKAVQPSIYARNVNAVQPSRFAGSVKFERSAGDDSPSVSDSPASDLHDVPTPSDLAPITHFGNEHHNLLVEVPFGSGRILFLSDPYILSNAGVSIVDNAQLGINLVEIGEGLIAFDEYHQGYGFDNNRFLQFFAGTPVIAIFLQGLLIIGLVFYSQSRRFARPVPEPEPDRLSKLEYVSAMAQLQGRAQAYDLAVENIYGEFRRRVARHFGFDNFRVDANQLAESIAARTGLDRASVSKTLFTCEEIIRGEPTGHREVVRLVAELRDMERKLNLSRVSKGRL